MLNKATLIKVSAIAFTLIFNIGHVTNCSWMTKLTCTITVLGTCSHFENRNWKLAKYWVANEDMRLMSPQHTRSRTIITLECLTCEDIRHDIEEFNEFSTSSQEFQMRTKYPLPVYLTTEPNSWKIKTMKFGDWFRFPFHFSFYIHCIVLLSIYLSISIKLTEPRFDPHHELCPISLITISLGH